jgi:hypothetical protein
MCIVCQWNSGKLKIDLNIEKLYCSGCTKLTSIPYLPNLKVLYCWDCKALTSIPELPKLCKLDCSDCTKVTSIPKLPELNMLDCSGCTSLTSIPLFPKMDLECKKCKWIDECKDFNDNIEALRRCQHIFKRKLRAKKLFRAIPTIIEIYYSPGCKGEFDAKRAFSKKI